MQKKIFGALTDNFPFLSAKRSRASKFQENINQNCFKTPLKGMISIKHGHCLLIHGSSVFFVYILDSPLPRLVQYVQKTQTHHVSIGSDHVLSTYLAVSTI